MSFMSMINDLAFPKISCVPGTPTILIRNIAARGMPQTYTLNAEGAAGMVRVRRGFLPFFWFAQEATMPFAHGMKVSRGWLDASFEVVLTANAPCTVEIR